jgi:hypothetical protein
MPIWRRAALDARVSTRNGQLLALRQIATGENRVARAGIHDAKVEVSDG